MVFEETNLYAYRMTGILGEWIRITIEYGTVFIALDLIDVRQRGLSDANRDRQFRL